MTGREKDIRGEMCMGEKMYKLRDKLVEELEKVSEKDTMTRDSLDIIDKLTHSIKSLDIIIAMDEEGEYSEEGEEYSRRDGRGRSSYNSYYREGGGSSYARGRGRNARRDSRGRYAREGGSSYERRGGGRSSYRNSSYEDGYSGHEDMMEMLEEMMDNASDSKEREAIQKLMEKMR